MRAWVRRIDLDTWESEVLELPSGPARWPAADAPPPWRVTSARPLTAGARLASDGGRWRVEPHAGGDPAQGTGGAPRHHTLAHGDALWIGNGLLVFLETPALEAPEALQRLDAEPFSTSAIRVWADWLLEHGDPLGHHLLGAEASPSVLEGLHRQVAAGRFELTWRNGLISAARLRCLEEADGEQLELLARFLALRVARWTQSLAVDLSAWHESPTGFREKQLAAALRLLLTGPHLPALEELTLGVADELLDISPLLGSLLDRLPGRFPRLRTKPAELTATPRAAWLRVVHAPEGLRLSTPGITDGRLSLEAGLWAGTGTPGQLTVLAPGVRRLGVEEHFLVHQWAPRWRLQPLSPACRLNGAPARSTRLIPGDVIEDPTGVRLRFEVG